MKTEKTIQLELTGNTPISEYVKAGVGLTIFLTLIGLVIIGTHAGTTYVDILLKGVH